MPKMMLTVSRLTVIWPINVIIVHANNPIFRLSLTFAPLTPSMSVLKVIVTFYLKMVRLTAFCGHKSSNETFSLISLCIYKFYCFQYLKKFFFSGSCRHWMCSAVLTKGLSLLDSCRHSIAVKTRGLCLLDKCRHCIIAITKGLCLLDSCRHYNTVITRGLCLLDSCRHWKHNTVLTKGLCLLDSCRHCNTVITQGLCLLDSCRH